VRRGEEFRYVVLAAQREGNRRLAAALRELNLTPAWAEVLIILDEHSPLTVKELGDLLVCESDHPSRLVNRMVSAGLLERRALASDRRAVALELTPAATELVSQVRAIEDGIYDFLEALPADSLSTVIATLSTLVAGQPSGLALERRKRHQGNGR
jgi:DNA-binding MarR family transcriptional regulator